MKDQQELLFCRRGEGKAEEKRNHNQRRPQSSLEEEKVTVHWHNQSRPACPENSREERSSDKDGEMGIRASHAGPEGELLTG